MNPDDKYYNVSVGEGIDLLKEDIKDIAIDSKESVEDLIAQYIESTKMEEGELGKLPPLPTSWASGILRLLKPIKGLYEADKKATLGASLFKTVAGDSSRRGFLKTIVGNSDKLRNKRILKKIIEDSKNYKSKFKFPDAGPGSKFYKKLQEIINPKSPKGILKKAKAEKKTFHAEGGRAGFDDGGPSQKDIDKGIAAIEKLKSSLMPESYEELIEIYKDKQKDLNIDIMEDAGGLGEMLGEGGVAGHSPLAVEQLPSQRRKKHIPHKFPKLGEGGRIGMMYGGDPGFAFSYGGSWADWKDNHASEMPLMDYINQKLPKARNPFSNGGEVEISWEEVFAKHMQGQPLTEEERKILGNVPADKAEGGRIGLANGTTMDAFDSMTPNRQYMMTGESDVHRIQPPMGGILPLAGAGIFALSQKDKDKKTPQKKEGPNYPEPPEGGRIGLLRTGIMEAFEHLTRRYGDDLGEWAGKLGDVRKFFTQVAPDKVDEIVKSYGQNRKIDLSKKIKEFLNDKIKRYKSGLEDIKKYGQHAPVKEVGDHAEELKWLIKETKKDIKAIDQYGLLKQSQKATKHAEGGRIGMAKGDTPSESWMRDYYFDGKGNYDTWMTFDQFKLGPGKELWLNRKAKGGRVGFQEGTGIMSQTGIPYYADKAVEGIVNSAETLSKLPFAGGELISKLLQSPPDKKMFSEALENITPGSWAENLGISSLAEAEGAKVSDKQRAIGDVLGLGTEMAVPVGVAFKTGQNLINQASKVFGKLKKGKTLDQTINDKITDFGQSRRDFNIMAGTSGLMVALKAIGLGGLLKGASKKVDDIKVTFKSDADYSYEGPESGWEGGNWTNISFEPLTKIGQKILDNIYQLGSKKGEGILPTREAVDEYAKFGAHADTTGYGTDAIEVIEKIKKAKGNIQVETFKPGNLKNNTLGELESIIFKGDDINFKNIMDKSDDLLTDTHYGNPRMVPSDQELEFVIDALKTKKAEGGIIEDDEFREFLEDRKNRDKNNFQRDFFEDFKRWKKRKEGNIMEAKDGGRIWRPKSAPKLTTTIPPEKGPTPQGLTYLLGDDIVQNIG